MADERQLAHAKEVYETMCRALDARNWHYNKDDEKLVVHFGVNGDDVPIHFVMVVDSERQLVRTLSRLPFQMSEEKRVDGAIATCVASYGLPDGSFDYDLSDGTITFRLTASIAESAVGEGLFHYLADCTCVVVDEYNDKFLAIDKGHLSITDFIQSRA